MTLEEAFAAVAAKKWRVLNLFQIAEPGTDKLKWRANVQVWLGPNVEHSGMPSNFAEHKDPVVAITSAMKNLEAQIGEAKKVKPKGKPVPVMSKAELALEAEDL